MSFSFRKLHVCALQNVLDKVTRPHVPALLAVWSWQVTSSRTSGSSVCSRGLAGLGPQGLSTWVCVRAPCFHPGRCACGPRGREAVVDEDPEAWGLFPSLRSGRVPQKGRGTKLGALCPRGLPQGEGPPVPTPASHRQNAGDMGSWGLECLM